MVTQGPAPPSPASATYRVDPPPSSSSSSPPPKTIPRGLSNPVMTVSAPGGAAPAVLSVQPRIAITPSAITAATVLIELLLLREGGRLTRLGGVGATGEREPANVRSWSRGAPEASVGLPADARRPVA